MSSVTHTGRAAITRGAGRPDASAAAVIVGIVCPASVLGPVHHVSVPSASWAVTLSSCGPRAATTIGYGWAPATARAAWTRYSSPSNDTASPRDNGPSTLRYSRRWRTGLAKLRPHID